MNIEEHFELAGFLREMKEHSGILRKVELIPAKNLPNGALLKLPWTITTEFWDNNKRNEEDTAKFILKMMAIQAGSDISRLLIEGDKKSSDPLLQAMNGLRRLLKVPKEQKRVEVPPNTKVRVALVGIDHAVRESEHLYALRLKVRLDVTGE